MGGNAIKGIKLRRIPTEEFEIFTSEVKELLRKKVKTVESLKYFSSKKDHGDLDLIILKDEIFSYDDLYRYLIEIGSREIHKNGPLTAIQSIISFEYKNFQVDLIIVDKNNLETTKFYFNYNDLNNLAGRIARSLGLRFGFDGLYLTLTDGVYQVEEILISRDPETIYKILDLNFNKYLEGFIDTKEIFDFIISSKHFSTYPFQYSNLDHANRTRNRKRKVYADFIDYIEDKKYLKQDKIDKDPVNFLLQFGIDLKSNVQEIFDKWENIKKSKSRLNGKIVLSLYPDLHHTKLVQILDHIKGLADYEFIIQEWGDKAINDLIIETYNKYQWADTQEQSIDKQEKS